MKILIFAVLTICLVATQGYSASKIEDYKLQEKCIRDAEERFDMEFKEDFIVYYVPKVTEDGKQEMDKMGNLGWEEKIFFFSYRNHFNRKMNRCFILVYAESPVIHQKLFDVNEVAKYGSIDIVQDLSPIYGNYTERLVCSTRRKKCNSAKEWEAFIKPYMRR